MIEHKAGDWVLVRARVLGTDPGTLSSLTRLSIKKTGGGSSEVCVWVSSDEVTAQAEAPFPPEPSEVTLLRSRQPNGYLFRKGSRGWTNVNGLTGMSYTWDQLFREHGPFDTYEPSGRVE